MKLFRPQPQRVEDAAWIWKLPVIPRVQLFIWKLLWECLPTCTLLSRRGISIQSTCPICSLEDESLDHAIFTCPRARCVWSLIGYSIRLDDVDSVHASFLLDLRMGSQQKKGLWAITAYQIWLAMNQFIFSDKAFFPHKVLRKIRLLVADSARVGIDNSGLWGSPAASAARRRIGSLSWEPPLQGLLRSTLTGVFAAELLVLAMLYVILRVTY